MQGIFDELIQNLDIYSPVLTEHYQLIHGDPRVENILFSSTGNPFTFIDYDTLMLGSTYIDMGDCLRSLMSVEDIAIPVCRFQEFVSGYSLGNPMVKIQDAQVLSALKYVTLELTLRFFIDSIEQNYFSWNPKLYRTAAEQNEDRAWQYWNLFKKINQEL
ncbi:MAG: phosphotransferase [Candidatus Moraniibacteriota bacterium]